MIFLDLKKESGEQESPDSALEPSEQKINKPRSRDEKIRRLAAQIESGEYEVDSQKLADAVFESICESEDKD